ncbi:MAG: sigma-70 family RNA polymerase sigma factor [Candidatus Poribacteria bacterium]|nr:sigma-70 family RNA polymerase sigma factor [Candidatus Poribacteria bacterium]
MQEEIDCPKVFPRCVEAGPDDVKLIEQFQRGDESVFDKLVVRYHDRTYRLAQRFVPNAEDALDITQDAFVRAYQGLPDFERKSQFYSWLYRITVNLCIDFLRKYSRREMMTYALESDDLPMMNIADLSLTSPSKVVENKELLGYLRRAILQLPPKQRQIVILRHWEGLPLKEIAHSLGRSSGTVKAHLFHAHRNLRKLLRHYMQDGV